MHNADPKDVDGLLLLITDLNTKLTAYEDMLKKAFYNEFTKEDVNATLDCMTNGHPYEQKFSAEFRTGYEEDNFNSFDVKIFKEYFIEHTEEIADRRISNGKRKGEDI